MVELQRDKSFDELMELRSATNKALDRNLIDALDNLAEAYVNVYGSKDGMEKMCDKFFESLAQQHNPGGWSGLLQYAIKIAG
jgi:hypothetical protein